VNRLCIALALMIGLSGPTTAWAGDESGAEAKAKPRLSAQEMASFAKQIEKTLAKDGARVAIVFRTSRPRTQLPQGVSYTHGAFFVYSGIQTSEGDVTKGYAVYNLYHGNGENLPKDRSFLKQDFPIDFVSTIAEDDVGVIIPSPEMQRRFMAFIGTPEYESLHVSQYSLVSNVFDARYQNCTEFVLDVVAATAWQTHSYPQIKANLKSYFTPTPIQTNGMARLFGPMVDSRLKFDDQTGPLTAATYESLSAFMREQDLTRKTYTISRKINLE
jgi:hypothetical protein